MNENKLSESFGTLSQTINELIKLGYTEDYNIKGECTVCNQTNTVLSPEKFTIDKIYRFEGASDPDYQSILYAISANDHQSKGILVNGYGLSSDEAASKLVEKLKTHNGSINTESLDTPIIQMDLYDTIEQLRSEHNWIDGERNSVTVFKSEQFRIVLIGLRENAKIKAHKAKGVISIQVLEGKLNFMAAEQCFEMEKGEMLALKEDLTHSVRALKETFFLLTIALSQG